MQLLAIAAGGATADIPTSKNIIGELWFQITSGTNTITVENSFDGGTTWSPIGIRKAIDDTIAASVAVAGLYYCKVGNGRLRLNCTGFVGAANVWAGVSNIDLV